VEHQEGCEVISLAAERARRAMLTPSRSEYRGALFEWRTWGESLSPGDLVAAVAYLSAGGLPGRGGPVASSSVGTSGQHVGLKVEFAHRESSQ